MAELLSRGELILHPQVERELRLAGWKPAGGAAKDLSPWRTRLESPTGFRLHPIAEQILLAFGGLRVGSAGTGIDRPRSRLDLNPALAQGEEDRVLGLVAPEAGEFLFPLGEVDDGHAFLIASSKGPIYLLMDEIYDHWASFDLALDSLLRGIQYSPT